MNINFNKTEVKEIKRVFSNELTEVAESILRKVHQVEDAAVDKPLVKQRVLTILPEVFEAVRQSVEKLPADGDEFIMNSWDVEECKKCAYSHSARVFAAVAARYTNKGEIVLVKKTQPKTT